MGELVDAVKRFYSSDTFTRFFTSDYRLKQLKQILSNKKTSAAERLNAIKYLDAQVGDLPKAGPDSGNMQVEFIGFAGRKNDKPEEAE